MPDSNPSDSREVPATLMLEEVWSRGDLDLVDELTTEDYVEYDPVRSEYIRGPEELKEVIASRRASADDLTKAVDETFVDGDAVVVTYTATGTHAGEILGVVPTDREFEVMGVFVYGIREGKLAEGTNIWDALGFLRQIGALPDRFID